MATDSSLPEFSKFDPDNVLQSLNIILKDNREQINKLLAAPNPSVASFILPLEELSDRLDRFWSTVAHLHAVVDSKKLRSVYNDCLPLISEYQVWLSQNIELYSHIETILQREEKSMSTAMRQALKNDLRDFRLSGVNLPADKRKQFANTSEQLALLNAKFEQNVMDATEAWTWSCTDPAEIRGLPRTALESARAAARRLDKQGYTLTLDVPCYLAVMMYCENREVRAMLYTAYVTRASNLSDNKDYDNSQVILDILRNRQQLAYLLDFENYSEYSLQTKMAESVDKVMEFLTELAQSALSRAGDEYSELKQFAFDSAGISDFQPWDSAFYAERLRQERYHMSAEDLRPYFPLPQVQQGLFEIIKRLYGVTFKQVPADTWHEDVICYGVYNSDSDLIAHCFTDLYVRNNKRGGAWMDECRTRRVGADGTLHLPAAYVICNFNRPIENDPALLMHDDVLTLFHEFGHALHQMLSKVDVAAVSGINGVAWDAVELPSQFMENWAWEREGLDLIAKHYKTGAKLPDELYSNMLRAKNFQSAMQMLRQIEFSLFDFILHQINGIEKADQVQRLLDEVRAQVSVVPQVEFNRFQNSFSHIFAGGYAAGYYSYKWAEVMSADAFAAFKDSGIFDSKTAAKFLSEILQRGGEREALENYVAFRGREPTVAALLQQTGIVEESHEQL